MGKFKTMDKSDVKYREKLATAKLADIKECGLGVGVKNLPEVKAALDTAKGDSKLKEPYVKVGIVGKHLVFRIKHKKGHVGDEDIILIKNFKQVEEMALARIQGAAEALADIVGNYTNDGANKVDKVETAVKAANAALKKNDGAEATKQHGIGLNYLKGLTGMATKTGLTKMIANFAKAKGVTPKDINTGDAELKRLFKQISTSYVALSAELDELDKEIEKYEDELANKEPETSNNDAAYKKNLKKMMKLYKGVVDDSKKGLVVVKKHNGDIKKLNLILSKTVEANAKPVVQAVLKVHKGMKDSYNGIDSHIQATIRTTESTYVKQCAEWGITGEDKGKNLMPLMNRAFALNFQAKGAYETGVDGLDGILEELIEKFDIPEAKKARVLINK